MAVEAQSASFARAPRDHFSEIEQREQKRSAARSLTSAAPIRRRFGAQDRRLAWALISAALGDLQSFRAGLRAKPYRQY